MTTTIRGADRERNVEREVYFSDHYFSMPQLCSLAHQLNHIHAMRPKSVVEVGIGNGFVSTYLKLSGVPVTTVDINPALGPDICAPLSEVRGRMAAPVDLVVCCEVLEHMPLEELDANISYLRSIGNRLFMTLPNSNRTWGFAGLAFVPKSAGLVFDFVASIPWKRPIEGGPHFWEVGYSRDCSQGAIIRRLGRHYPKIKAGRFALNPYHIWFACE